MLTFSTCDHVIFIRMSAAWHNDITVLCAVVLTDYDAVTSIITGENRGKQRSVAVFAAISRQQCQR